jgi:hypothetical protein
MIHCGLLSKDVLLIGVVSMHKEVVTCDVCSWNFDRIFGCAIVLQVSELLNLSIPGRVACCFGFCEL